MNTIHKINAINRKELENGVSDEASWHADYRDTSYIYIGNLHEKIAEKDLVTIFSQWGNPTHVNLVKDRDSGKSRGFAYLKYEDQRSCVLAVDNFNGVLIYERPLKVDHTYYKLREGQKEDDFLVDYSEATREQPKIEAPKKTEAQAALVERLSTEANLEVHQQSEIVLADDDDFTDPMANMLKRPMETEHKKHRHHKKRRHKERKSEKDGEPKNEEKDSIKPEVAEGKTVE